MTASDEGRRAEADRWQQLITATMTQDQYLRLRCMEMAAEVRADPDWQIRRAKLYYREITQGDWTSQDES